MPNAEELQTVAGPRPHGELEALGAYSPSGSGAPSARTTRRAATAGATSRTTRPAAAPIAGAKTACSGICDRECRLCFALALWNGKRSDPQGAALRPHRSRGQSRRGRQGVLLLPRLHADALVHEGALQVSAGASSRTRGWSRRTAAAAKTSRSSSSPTPASSTRAATSTSSPSTPRPRPTTF